MHVRLVVVGGKADKRQLSLSLPAVLGRSREAGLTIAHSLISRNHCELSDQNGAVLVRDLGSLNGTFIGETQIEQAKLYPGDQFSIGPLTFRVEYEYVGDIASAPGAPDAGDRIIAHAPHETPAPGTTRPQSVDALAESPASISPGLSSLSNEPPIELADPIAPAQQPEPPVELADPSGAEPGPMSIAPADGQLPDLSQWSGVAEDGTVEVPPDFAHEVPTAPGTASEDGPAPDAAQSEATDDSGDDDLQQFFNRLK